MKQIEMDDSEEKSLSIAGFVCSLCGFITCGITSVIGLILSIVGLAKNNKNGFAIAGIILSSIPLLYFSCAVWIEIMGNINIEEVEMVDFSVMTIEEAKKWCDENNVKCIFNYNYSETVPSGKLISQQVEPGIVINEDESISIVYSKGAKATQVEEETITTEYSNSVEEKYTLIEHYISGESNQFYTYIEGKIKNNRNRDLSYIQITFTTYDKIGRAHV